MKNPYKPGDQVKLKVRIKDGYGDEWHSAGDVVRVESIARDGIGLMFSTGMGIGYGNVEPVGACKQRIELETLLAASKKAAASFPTGHGA